MILYDIIYGLSMYLGIIVMHVINSPQHNMHATTWVTNAASEKAVHYKEEQQIETPPKHPTDT